MNLQSKLFQIGADVRFFKREFDPDWMAQAIVDANQKGKNVKLSLNNQSFDSAAVTVA